MLIHMLLTLYLSTDNAQVSEQGSVLIADYGTCLVRSSSSRSQEAVGTVAWMAPEVLQNKQQYTNAADVYSFGMCLYEIISGEVPFSDIPSVAIPVAVSKGNRPQLAKDLPKAWVKLIQLCWHERPAKRPAALCRAPRRARRWATLPAMALPGPPWLVAPTGRAAQPLKGNAVA